MWWLIGGWLFAIVFAIVFLFWEPNPRKYEGMDFGNHILFWIFLLTGILGFFLILISILKALNRDK